MRSRSAVKPHVRYNFGITCNGPQPHERKFLPRDDKRHCGQVHATLVTIQPLDQQRAATLLEQAAPAIDPASKSTILRQSHGHPQTIVAYAERLAAHGDEERHQLESFKLPAKWLNIFFMFVLLVAIILIQRQISNDIAGAVLSGLVVMTMWFLRPRFREITRK